MSYRSLTHIRELRDAILERFALSGYGPFYLGAIVESDPSLPTGSILPDFEGIEREGVGDEVTHLTRFAVEVAAPSVASMYEALSEAMMAAFAVQVTGAYSVDIDDAIDFDSDADREIPVYSAKFGIVVRWTAPLTDPA